MEKDRNHIPSPTALIIRPPFKISCQEYREELSIKMTAKVTAINVPSNSFISGNNNSNSSGNRNSISRPKSFNLKMSNNQIINISVV